MITIGEATGLRPRKHWHDGKMKFETREAADERIKIIRRARNARQAETLEPYFCLEENTAHWHIGHRKPQHERKAAVWRGKLKGKERSVAVNQAAVDRVIDRSKLPAKDSELRCAGCRKRPYEIDGLPEVAVMVSDLDLAAIRAANDLPGALDRWVRKNDGSYNVETNRFMCDQCYMKAGAPGTPEGWKTP